MVSIFHLNRYGKARLSSIGIRSDGLRRKRVTCDLAGHLKVGSAADLLQTCLACDGIEKLILERLLEWSVNECCADRELPDMDGLVDVVV